MGISNELKNIDNTSFANHSVAGSFIRTMEDDLKKIKNSAAENNGAASGVSSAPVVPSKSNNLPKSNNLHQDANVPASISSKLVEFSLPFQASKSAPNSSIKLVSDAGSTLKSASVAPPNPAPVSATPENLPIDESIAFASSRVAPKRPNILFDKARNTNNLIDETEKLSPEARLAKQLSSQDDNETEFKEGAVKPPLIRTSSVISGQLDKIDISPNSASSELFSHESEKNPNEEIIKENNLSFFSGKFIKIFFAVLVIFGIAAGAYYFYNSKKPIIIPISSETFISGAAEAVINADLNTDLNNSVRLYFSSAKPSGVYRLILKDKDGQNDLPLENFGKSLNIVLPDFVAVALEKDYNLIVFNYPEKKYLRLGLVLKAKNSSDISSVAGRWEPDIYKNVAAIFMGNSGIYNPSKSFNDNKRDNFNIRYLPLGFENTALNYAIDKNKKFLLIAASKQDIFNLIDKIKQKN